MIELTGVIFDLSMKLLLVVIFAQPLKITSGKDNWTSF